ncbi:hypothetical protein [Janthinobacterium sp. CG3]|nr:hypothetical protein [Janthinobacterium sp. CG3]
MMDSRKRRKPSPPQWRPVALEMLIVYGATAAVVFVAFRAFQQ